MHFLISPVLSAFVWMHRHCSTWLHKRNIHHDLWVYKPPLSHFGIWEEGDWSEADSLSLYPRSKIHKRASGERILTSDLLLNISEEDPCMRRTTMIVDATIRSTPLNGRRAIRMPTLDDWYISSTKVNRALRKLPVENGGWEDIGLGFEGRCLIAGHTLWEFLRKLDSLSWLVCRESFLLDSCTPTHLCMNLFCLAYAGKMETW